MSHFTGTLSLLASKYVRGCVGVDEVRMAVEDAKYNAERNNITNCTFVCGKVEQVRYYTSAKGNDALVRLSACCQY